MIDTLKASRKLKASGFSEEQAESIINVVADTNEQTATKEDIHLLQKDIQILAQSIAKLKEYVDIRFDHIDKRFAILQWMTGLSLSGVIAILIVLAF